MNLKLFLLSFCGLSASAQVGIGTTSLTNDLLLKIQSPNKGVLIPNVAIPDINFSPPVNSPVKSLFVYNKQIGKKGFVFWEGTKWSEILDTNNVYSILGLTVSYSTTNSTALLLNTVKGALNYAEMETPGTVWTKIPGLEKNITIKQTNNNVNIITEGMVQAGNKGGFDSNVFFTYAIGIFIDGKLRGVRNFSSRYATLSTFDFFSINTSVAGLSLGSHFFEVYATIRRNDYSFGSTNDSAVWMFGEALDSSSITNDMAKVKMFIKVTEKTN